MHRAFRLSVVFVAFAVLAAAAPLHAELDPGLLAGLKARAIGPAAMSGRVAAVEGVESNPDVLYVGAAAGGVWKSVNGGLSWQPIFDDQPVASIGAIAVNQANPDVVWVGTGEAAPRNSVSVGDGVYRSLDGGRTWKHVGLEKTEHVSRIVLDPGNPDVAYVAALGKVWGENPERGVFKTVDGGRSWKRVLFADERTGAAELVMDPRNPNKLFAGLWQFRRWPWSFRSGGPGSGLYVTYDGGESWKRLTEDDGLPKGDLGRIGLAISRSNPEIVYALVEAEKSAFLRSADGGKSWKTVNDDPETAERPFYYSDIRVDPAWPNRVYNLAARVQVSNDSGKTFELLGRSREIHGDHHALWIDPKDPGFLVIGNDGGVGVSRDRGETWAFVGTLPIGQFYHVAVDLDTPYHVYGGLQDNGSWRGPSSVWSRGGIRNSDWEPVGGGDGFDVRPDPADSSRGYSMSQGGALVRWDVRSGERKWIRPPNPDGRELRFNWNAGLAVDPFDAGTVYYGSQYLHKSTDRGESWTTISPDLTTNNPEWQKQETSGGLTLDVTAAENYTTILAIAPSPVAKGEIWVGTDDGRIQLTRDGGTTWTSVEANVPGVPAHSWIPHIKASSHDASTAFVVFDDHRRSNWTTYVYRTDDYGKSWTSLAGKDLRGFAQAIEQDPVDKDLLFLGTEFGLWISPDGGRRWLRWTSGFPTAPVFDLVVHPRDQDLVIATHGRALYVLDDVTPLRTLSEATLKEPLHLFPAGDSLEHSLQGGGGARGGGAGEFRGQSRPYGAILTYSLNLPGLAYPDAEKERQRKEAAPPAPAEKPAAQEEKQAAPKEGERDRREGKEPKVEIVIADAAGKEVRTFEGPAKLGVNRAVWDLGRNAWKEPPRERRRFFTEEEPGGPEVVPGTYGVTVSFRGHEAKGTVKVLPDPRFAQQTADAWKARDAALEREGRLQNTATEAIERVLAAKGDVDVVLAKVKKRSDGLHGAAKAKAEEASKPLVQAGEKLKASLVAVEKKLWVPPHTKGIVREADVFSKLGNLDFALTSSWAPPDPTQQTLLKQTESLVEGVLAEVNKLFAGDVAAFRHQAEEAGIGLLPAKEPLVVPKE